MRWFEGRPRSYGFQEQEKQEEQQSKSQLVGSCWMTQSLESCWSDDRHRRILSLSQHQNEEQPRTKRQVGPCAIIK